MSKRLIKNSDGEWVEWIDSMANTAKSVATQASEDVSTLQTTVNNISDSVDTISDDLQTVEDNIGDLADLETTAKTDIVSAINEINSEVTDITLKSLNMVGKLTEVSSSFQSATGTNRFYRNKDNFPFGDLSSIMLRFCGNKIQFIQVGGSGSLHAMVAETTVLFALEITHSKFLEEGFTERQWDVLRTATPLFGGTITIRNVAIFAKATISYSSAYNSVVIVGSTRLSEALSAESGGGSGGINFDFM